MIADNETNKVFLSGKLKENYKKTCEEIEYALKAVKGNYGFLPNTNDIWARDYMPIQVSGSTFIEYRYDPDYLQGATPKRRGIKTYPDIVCDAIGLKTQKSDLILDGDNVVKSSNIIILTDKALRENKHKYSKTELIKTLHSTFEVEKVVLIPWDNDCEFGHSDGMLRFIDNETVLVSGFYEQVDNQLKDGIINSFKKANLNIEWLRCEQKESEDNIAYINFLQTKDYLFLPKLNTDQDQTALEQIKYYFKDYSKNKRIFQIDMTDIVKYGGALNCISWTIKE